MNRKGFTLIELMIVIAIISILASIIIPNITKARATAQLRACMSNMKALMTAGQMMLADYPGGSEELKRCGYGCYPDEAKAIMVPDYIASLPTCPTSHEEYNFDFRIPYDYMCMHHSGDCRAHYDAMMALTDGSCGRGPGYHACHGKTYWCHER